MAAPTRIHPALLDRLTDLAADAALVQAAFAAVRPTGPEQLPDLVRNVIERRRAAGTAPTRQIPATAGGSAPPDWLCRLAGEPDAEERRARRGTWPASERRSPLELETNPVLRLSVALVFRAEAAFGLPRRAWPAFVHIVRWAGLAVAFLLVLSWTHVGLALLVLGVGGVWMLLDSPHVGERVAAAAAVAEFNDALETVLAGDAAPGGNTAAMAEDGVPLEGDDPDA